MTGFSTAELLGVRELPERIRTGETSAVAEVERSLAAIDAANDELCAFVRVDHRAALDTARRVDRAVAGGASLPLAGVTVAVKDNIDVAGRRTSAGSRILRDRIPAADAPAVARLTAAGAIVVGSTNMHEFALGGTSDNPHWGPVANPLGPGLSPGGSSGGSAVAVAAGLCTIALGTDTCGSVRMPASLTRTVGLRPTFGAVPVDGTVPLAPTLDTVGPMTRTIADNAAVLEVLTARPAALDEPLSSPGTLRFFIAHEGDPLAQPVDDTMAAVLAVLDGVGRVDRAADTGWVAESVAIAETMFLREAADYHAPWLHARAAEYGDDVLAGLRAGADISPEQYARAAEERATVVSRARSVLGPDGVLVLPVFPFTRLEHGVATVQTAAGTFELSSPAMLRYISVAAVAGFPALSIPAGSDADGLPVGVQLVGRPGTEALLYALATHLTEHLDAHTRRK